MEYALTELILHDSLRDNAGDMLATNKSTLIAVVDDDASVRESLPELLRTFGFAATPFVSAEAFLQSAELGDTRCLISDVMMPSMSGPQLQQEVNRRKLEIPIIFITGRRDSTLRKTLLAQGAVECLFKPFRAEEVLLALKGALSG